MFSWHCGLPRKRNTGTLWPNSPRMFPPPVAKGPSALQRAMKPSFFSFCILPSFFLTFVHSFIANCYFCHELFLALARKVHFLECGFNTANRSLRGDRDACTSTTHVHSRSCSPRNPPRDLFISTAAGSRSKDESSQPIMAVHQHVLYPGQGYLEGHHDT